MSGYVQATPPTQRIHFIHIEIIVRRGATVCLVAVLCVSEIGVFQSSIQQKVSWVKNSTNQWVLALDCGAGPSFSPVISLRLVLSISPFLVSQAKLIGNF
jgi:hypothetical protein